MKKLDKKVDQVTYGLNQIISKNLNEILSDRCISKESLCDFIEKEKGFTTSRPNLSRCLNHPDKNSPPLAFLLACCDYLNISFTNLISENFDKNEKLRDSNKNPPYLIDTPSLTRIYEESYSSTTKSSLEDQQQAQNDPFFIDDPNSPLFKKYIQTYYCYFYPTVSDENKSEDTLLTGELKLYGENGECKAKLTIDTGTLNEDGKPNLKIYEGSFILSTSVHCIHCILKSKEVGEYCFIVFRHSHVNYDSLDCRMAEVLSTSSTVDKRYPTVLRMFLSNQKISDEDLRIIAPHLWLNYSQITITEAGLLSLEDISDDYKTIIHNLLDKKDPEMMYRFKEDDALKIAEEYLSKEELPIFLAELRLKSFAYRYNKVSPKLDSTVWTLLSKKGYYKKNKKNSFKN